MRTATLLVIVPAFAAGCFTAQYDAAKPLAERVSPADTTVTIVTPADGMDERPKTYAHSGERVAESLQRVLVARGFKAEVSAGAASPAVAKGSSEPPRYDFYTRSLTSPAVAASSRGLTLTPDIMLWSDRVTEWSGKSDKLKIRMLLTDARTGATVDDRNVTAKSKWWTFGGDHPQQMLDDLFATWADKVFETPAKR